MLHLQGQVLVMNPKTILINLSPWVKHCQNSISIKLHCIIGFCHPSITLSCHHTGSLVSLFIALQGKKSSTEFNHKKQTPKRLQHHTQTPMRTQKHTPWWDMVTTGPRDDVCYSSAHVWVAFQTDKGNHNRWAHGTVQKAKVEKTEHDIISLEVLCCSPKNCLLFGIRYQRHMLTMSDERL